MNLSQPYIFTRAKVLVAALTIGFALAVAITVVVYVAISVNHVQQDQIEANQRSIANNSRLDRLEQPPSEADLAKASARALQACAKLPVCRRQFRTAVRRSRVSPRDLPALQRQIRRAQREAGAPPPASAAPSGSSSGPAASLSPTGRLRARRSPARTRGPSPGPGRAPAAPAPAPNQAEARPADPQPTPAPTPAPTPPPNVQPPRVPVVPNLPPVCTPLIGVNCPGARSSARFQRPDLPSEDVEGEQEEEPDDGGDDPPEDTDGDEGAPGILQEP